jgi:hypothetical protein
MQAMCLGKRPNGDLINPIMPWPNFASFTDELTALWLNSYPCCMQMMQLTKKALIRRIDFL